MSIIKIKQKDGVKIVVNAKKRVGLTYFGQLV
jgi:hypothetical protein